MNARTANGGHTAAQTPAPSVSISEMHPDPIPIDSSMMNAPQLGEPEWNRHALVAMHSIAADATDTQNAV